MKICNDIINIIMNQAYQRIRDHLSHLQSEKLKLEQKIKDIQKKDTNLKAEIHHTELYILINSAQNNPSQDTNKLFREMNTIRHDTHDLHENEQELKTLNSSLHELDKKIILVHFWMKHSEYGDPVKQAESIKHVFS